MDVPWSLWLPISRSWVIVQAFAYRCNLWWPTLALPSLRSHPCASLERLCTIRPSISLYRARPFTLTITSPSCSLSSFDQRVAASGLRDSTQWTEHNLITMRFRSSSILLCSFLYYTIFLSVQTQSCSSLRQRREWRALKREDRKAFISALKCLATQPSSITGAKTPIPLRLFDDFNFVHSSLVRKTHFTAMFLPCELPIK